VASQCPLRAINGHRGSNVIPGTRPQIRASMCRRPWPPPKRLGEYRCQLKDHPVRKTQSSLQLEPRLFLWNVAGRRHRLWNAAYLGEARHYLGIGEDRIEDPRWRITCIPERVPLVAGFENQIRVANFSRKQSRAWRRSRSPAATSATQYVARRRLQRNLIAASRPTSAHCRHSTSRQRRSPMLRRTPRTFATKVE
jgi:hypothetical protein